MTTCSSGTISSATGSPSPTTTSAARRGSGTAPRSWANNDRYDRRPAAFWDYEGGWPEGAVGEAHAVYLLPDTSPEHRAKIEQDWLGRVRIALACYRDVEAARDGAASAHGVPGWFFDRHAPGLKARLDAARRAWRESMGSA